MTARDLLKKEPVTALLVGGLIGGGAALLLAPKSGRQLRDDMRKTASDVTDTVQCYASRAKDATLSSVRKGRDYLVGGKDLIAGAVGAGVKASLQEWQKLARSL